jgi:RNA-directed DNA polymerase
MLDLLDKELERRGHKFCRYADDFNVYVRSERAGYRVMKSLKAFLEGTLKLKVNDQKSAVGRVYRRSFLGFTFTSEMKSRRRVSPEAIKQLKEKIKNLTRHGKGKSMEWTLKSLERYLAGWRAYYGFGEVKSPLEKVEAWTHRKLRCAYWRQWKTGKNRYIQLIKRGVGKALASQTAGSSKGPWRVCASPGLCIALPRAYFREHGILLT